MWTLSITSRSDEAEARWLLRRLYAMVEMYGFKIEDARLVFPDREEDKDGKIERKGP
jgi:hypothetical protein